MLQKLLKYRFLFDELVEPSVTAVDAVSDEAGIYPVFRPGYAPLYHYLFCGNLIFTYFSESTKSGIRTLMDNAKIFTKVNVPKYLFLLSKNVQTFISFLLTLVIFFLFVAFDRMAFTWKILCLTHPVCLAAQRVQIVKVEGG